MAQQTNRSYTLIDILIIAWTLSTIPTILEFIHSAPGFPDVAPHYGPLALACFGIFVLLQFAIAIAVAARYRLTAWSLLLALILAFLALLPEALGLIIATIFYLLTIPAAAVIAAVLSVRLIRRLRLER